ncbi:hypothetical protein SLS64_011148 [Diaporthe eres]|uniref:Uncharacterized protein n=1 Tax=Diaporthe eres TaxID=83184 RepID=A0ABR1P3P9_DIAER
MQFSTAFFAMTLALGVSALEPSIDGVVYWCYQADGVKFTAVDLCTSRGMQTLAGRSGDCCISHEALSIQEPYGDSGTDKLLDACQSVGGSDVLGTDNEPCQLEVEEEY